MPHPEPPIKELASISGQDFIAMIPPPMQLGTWLKAIVLCNKWIDQDGPIPAQRTPAGEFLRKAAQDFIEMYDRVHAYPANN
jgi:hypothetical protein